MSAADLRGSGINVMAGYETTFLISPSQIAATDEVKSLPFYKRNCLFPDEAKLKKLVIFKYYPKNKLDYSRCNFHFWMIHNGSSYYIERFEWSAIF